MTAESEERADDCFGNVDLEVKIENHFYGVLRECSIWSNLFSSTEENLGAARE